MAVPFTVDKSDPSVHCDSLGAVPLQSTLKWLTMLAAVRFVTSKVSSLPLALNLIVRVPAAASADSFLAALQSGVAVVVSGA
ncbi:MAG TPA: hypothetical protein PLL72_22425, partial [Burkholderiaceae bacterium]|nr:hypothetical protein [Burkholderiaceae bacterium]